MEEPVQVCENKSIYKCTIGPRTRDQNQKKELLTKTVTSEKRNVFRRIAFSAEKVYIFFLLAFEKRHLYLYGVIFYDLEPTYCKVYFPCKNLLFGDGSAMRIHNAGG
jgi:hypothetical protein